MPGSSSRRQRTTSRAHSSELCPALQLPSSAPGAFPGHPGAAKTPSPDAKDTFAIRARPRTTCPSTGPAGRADPRVRARRLRGGSTFQTLRAMGPSGCKVLRSTVPPARSSPSGRDVSESVRVSRCHARTEEPRVNARFPSARSLLGVPRRARQRFAGHGQRSRRRQAGSHCSSPHHRVVA